VYRECGLLQQAKEGSRKDNKKTATALERFLALGKTTHPTSLSTNTPNHIQTKSKEAAPDTWKSELQINNTTIISS